MAEGGSNFGFMDSRQFIYLPTWVELTILCAAAMLLILAAIGVYEALTTSLHSEAVVFYLSVAQSAALVLVFFLLVTFSRRDANVEQLHQLTDEFLRRYIGGALGKVSVPELGLKYFTVQDEGSKTSSAGC